MQEYKNKLVIIGNGFDLAHGLKTSYNDFIKWYLHNICKIMKEDEYYEDILVEVKFKDKRNIIDYILLPSEKYEIDWFFEDNINSIFYLERKSQFFGKLLIQLRNFSWVDIPLSITAT